MQARESRVWGAAQVLPRCCPGHLGRAGRQRTHRDPQGPAPIKPKLANICRVKSLLLAGKGKQALGKARKLTENKLLGLGPSLAIV